MNDLQIDHLRDIAIDHLPRAQAIRDKASLIGGAENFYSALYHVSLMERGKASARAEEFAAANVIEVVCLLRNKDVWDKSIPSSKRKDVLEELVTYAKELCMLTGRTIPWLEDLPSVSVQEEEGDEVEKEKEPPAAPHKRIESIAGHFLDTKKAAYWLGISEQRLREWRSQQSGPVGTGALKPIKPDGSSRLRWSGDEIIAYLNKKKG